MTTLPEALTKASAPDRSTIRPEFFRLPADLARLEELLKRNPRVEVHDTLHEQVRELVRSLNPAVRFGREELDAAAVAHLGGTPAHEYGVWVHYPWSHKLVHLLDEAEFALVRTDRNRNKITREEQAVLATKRVGVIGLSVGQSVALTMALERSFGEIRLADFDDLELSNLNRIRSGVHEMGLPKVVNTAREIAELDPFLKVTIYPEGITRTNLHGFFTDGGQLDVLIEECDSVDIKILARQKAKELGVPVVMDMSDRGCLDVERFDLDPERPIMHGWIDHLDLEAAGRPMTNEEKIPFMLPIVGVETLSARMKASMIEMGSTLSTWPQLASSVTLGGALAGDAYRRMLMGQFNSSGRWYVDLEELVCEAMVDLEDRPEMANLSSTSDHGIPSFPTMDDTDPLTKEDAVQLAKAGAMAPSAGNMQPWSFRFTNGSLHIIQDLERSRSRWDPDGLMAHIGIGASLENVLLQSGAMGLPIQAQVVSGNEGEALVVTAHRSRNAQPQGPAGTELVDWIWKRCTNRKLASYQPLGSDVVKELQAMGSSLPGCTLQIFDTREQLDELASVCAGSERIRLLDEQGHREFFQNEIRWTPAEARDTGDGLDVATLELTDGDAAALRIVSDQQAMELVRAWGGGKGLERFSLKGIRSASAVILLRVSSKDLDGRVTGGRCMQRVWLKANQMGLSVHPISAPIFMAHALPFLHDLSSEARQEIEIIWERFRSVTGSLDSHPLFMMRISHAGEPTVRSHRRPLEQMFSSPK
jgi:nitroreductase